MTGRFVVVLLCAAGGVGCEDVNITVTSPGASPGTNASAQVTRVVDGDTVKVRLSDGRRETVRYIGIDTPESVKPEAPVECFGPQAAARNRALVDDERVRLEFGREARDRFGRLLAYVFRTRDNVFVNERLIREGFAQPLRISPNTQYAPAFSRLARQAQRAKVGLWGACHR